MRTQLSFSKFMLSVAITLGLLLPFHSQAYAQSCDVLYPSPHERIGYNVTRELDKTIADYDAARLGAGWYLDYATQVDPVRPNGMDYAQMIRARYPAPTAEQLDTQVGAVIDANPGALWILGNEPDRPGNQQDGLTPAEYAAFYHDTYTYIKARDASSRVAIAGVVQPTPLRLHYLSTVLSEYEAAYGEAMPIDVWTTHSFILREQRPTVEDPSWGTGIPPGIDDQDALGRLYEVDDHGNIDIFKEQIIGLRQWMADNGQRDKELLVTEYGILFPDWYAGFSPEETRDFMFDTFDFMLEETDDQIGYPADGNRLVQRFSWFSLNSPGYDGVNPNFFDHSFFDNRTFEIEFLGEQFEQYVISNTVTYPDAIDLSIDRVQFVPEPIVTPESEDAAAPQPSTTTISVTIDLKNVGNVDAQNVTLRLWDMGDGTGLTILGSSEVIVALPDSCTDSTEIVIPWTVDTTITKSYALMVDMVAANLSIDSNTTNNQYVGRYFVGELSNSHYLPLILSPN